MTRTPAILLLFLCGLARAQTPAPAPGEDPTGGKFTLEQATEGLKGKGALTAAMEITVAGKPLGTLHCELLPDKAPVAVANFVGLARGLRPFRDPRSQAWVKRPLYDGMVFHRVVPGYIIQAGDPQCQNDPGCMGRAGTGDPGYQFPDEISDDLRMDQGGVLAMANRYPGINGSQFFITEKESPWLAGHQTIFGKCAEVELVQKISAVKRGPRDMPEEPVLIKKLTISRKAK